MRKTVQLLFAGCILLHGGFVQADDATALCLVVEVRNLAGFDEPTIRSAEQIVNGIFHGLGVQVTWQAAVHVGRVDAGPGTKAGRPDVWINLIPVTAARMSGDNYEAGLAAVPKDGQIGSSIWVFRPILETIIDHTVFLTPQRNPTRLRNVLLAHVMAHEIGHLLLGSAKHSVSGIMTRELDLRAIRLACTGSLAFSPSESGKIRATVQRIEGSDLRIGGPAGNVCPARRRRA